MFTRGTYWGFEADAHIRELKEFSYRYVSGDILYIWEALNQSDIYQKQHILHIGAYQKTYDTDIYQLTNSVRYWADANTNVWFLNSVFVICSPFLSEGNLYELQDSCSIFHFYVT